MYSISALLKYLHKLKFIVLCRLMGPVLMYTVVFQSSYRGHFGPSSSSHETRQKTLFERLTGRKTLTPDEWKKREEEVIERMLKFVVMEPQEPSSESYFYPTYVDMTKLFKCVYVRVCMGPCIK